MLGSLVLKESSQNPDELLRRQRELIRDIDGQIARLLAERLSVVEEIASIKREHNIPLVQPSQWNTVVRNYEQYALDDPRFAEFLQKYLDLLHQYSLKMQESLVCQPAARAAGTEEHSRCCSGKENGTTPLAIVVV